MKVAILTDSNSGITQDEANKLGVFVLPMPFTIDGQEYKEDINLSQEEFYDKLMQKYLLLNLQLVKSLNFLIIF